MTSGRTEILQRVRQAVHDAPPAPRPVRTPLTRLDGDIITPLVDRLADYGTTVVRVPAESLASAVRDALSSVDATSMCVPADIAEAWLNVVTATVHPDQPPLSTIELDGIDAVLTGCAVAIAETGTIVLDAGTAQGRRALTLVPDVHICVVDATQVVATVSEATAILDPARPLTWISGPSATSDIELDRVEGVHGPRTLIVLLSA